MAAAKPALKLLPESSAGPSPNQLRGWIESGEPRSVIDVLVTPQLAEVMLEYNESSKTNRKLSKGSVGLAVSALRDKRWENTGEPIIFSDAKMMNDGQHRLHAVVQTGIPAVMDLRFGIRRRAFAATNSGGKRTGADALAVAGVSGNPQIAAVARLILSYERGLPLAARQRVPNDLIVLAVERWPDIPLALRFSCQLPALVKNAAMHSLAFFAQRTANEPSVRDFFHILATGEGRASDPPHRLREALLRHRGGHDTGIRVQHLALGIIAWNAWRTPQRRLDRLGWRQTEPYPKIEGLKL